MVSTAQHSGQIAQRVMSVSYLDHLTDRDLGFLARVARPDLAPATLRSRPEEAERALADPRVFEAVFGSPEETEEALAAVSPFLVFAVAVHRAAEDLAGRSYVEEWAGPRQRIPVFAADELRAFAEDRARRLFLAELLASYIRVRSGVVWVATPRGPERRRWSDLDLLRLASLLEVLPEPDHARIYRRLGDLALFLTGVFPDHVAARLFRPVDVQRLARAVGAGGTDAAEEVSEALAVRGGVGLLEHLGERWYRNAVHSGGSGRAPARTLEAVADRFSEARRILNLLTDRYLFPYRRRWFPTGESVN